MTSRTRIYVTLLCLAILLPSHIASADTEARIEVVLTGEPELYEAVVDQFGKSHPHIKVDYRTEVFGTWQEKLSILLASNLAPDAFILSWAYFGEFAETGALLDLDPLLKRDYNEMRASDVVPAAWESAKYGGRQLGIPFLPGHTMMFFNKDILAQTGVSEPLPNWTWNDFVETARKTTYRNSADESSSRYGIDAVNYWGFWSSALFSHGGSVWNSSGTGFVINSEAGRRSFDFIVDLVNGSQVTPPAGLGDVWSAGRLTFKVGSSSVLNTTRKNQSFDFAVTNYPAGPFGQFNTGGILPVCGKASTQQPEAVWTFMKFLLSPEMLEYRAGYGQMPVRASVIRRLPDPYIRTFASGVETARVWTNRYYNQLLNVINPHISSMISGAVPVSNALTNAEAALNGYLTSISGQ
jgi:multiple sugar transport system substrate-binding protein